MSDTQSDLPRRRMQLVAEQQVPDPVQGSPAALPSPRPTTQTPRALPPELQQELQARAAWRAGVIGSLNVAATILAVRLILLLATLGAFALAYLAIQAAQPMQLGAVALYLAGVVLPLTWLASRR